MQKPSSEDDSDTSSQTQKWAEVSLQEYVLSFDPHISIHVHSSRELHLVHSPHCSPYIFSGDYEENLLNNQDLCYLLITSFFLTTFCLIEKCYFNRT